jgi:hypothetical protein
MPRARPSLALGLSLISLTLLGAVVPPAAHAAEHVHDADHHGPPVDGHHEAHDGSYSHDADGHLHIDLNAVVAGQRPDVDPATVPQPCAVAVVITAVVLGPPPGADTARLPARTHDPPNAPRAPPTS